MEAAHPSTRRPRKSAHATTYGSGGVGIGARYGSSGTSASVARASARRSVKPAALLWLDSAVFEAVEALL